MGATDALLRKLAAFGPLPDDDVSFLSDLLSESRFVVAGTVLSAEDEVPRDVRLVASGLACRSKRLSNGRRQIFAFLLPGDFCDLHVFMLDRMDHDIITLADSSIVNIPRHKVLEMTERPSIARTLLLATLVDEAILREWITNLGQRPAPERLAHLFCELYFRMRSVGLLDEAAYELPITQAELADTVGSSLVHTNKSLRKLIQANLLTFTQGRVTISDVDELIRLSGFRPNYLHLRGGTREPDARPACDL